MFLPVGFLCSEGSLSLFYCKKLESNDLLYKKVSVHLDFMTHFIAGPVALAWMGMASARPLPMCS